MGTGLSWLMPLQGGGGGERRRRTPLESGLSRRGPSILRLCCTATLPCGTREPAGRAPGGLGKGEAESGVWSWLGMSWKEPNVAFPVFRCFTTRIKGSHLLGGIDWEASPVLDGRGHLSLGAQSSITRRSSSSLLVSLNSTRVCFLMPSKLLFLVAFEGASGTAGGCAGLQGTTPSFRAIDPDSCVFSVSSPGAQGTSLSPHTCCSPGGKGVLGLPVSWCELVELGPEAGMSR